MVLKYGIAWIPMVFIAVANGALRQFAYGKYPSELLAHQVSSMTGMILFCLYTWFLNLHWPLESSRQAVAIGLIWLILTVAFEFIFRHYFAGHS